MKYYAVIDTNVLVSVLLSSHIKHFPEKVFVVTPNQFLNILNNDLKK